MFTPDGLYEIPIDHNGDAVADITFRLRFRFTNTAKAATLMVGGKAVKISQTNGGVMATRQSGHTDCA